MAMTSTEDVLRPPSSSSSEETCSFALQLASLSVLPMALKSAVELEVFEVLAGAGAGARLSPAEISARLPRQKQPETPAMLERMLSLLASYGVLTCSSTAAVLDDDDGVGRKYGATPVAKFFTRNGEDGASLAPFAIMTNHKIFMEKWYYLKDAVMDGELAFDKAYGMGLYEFNSKNSGFNTVFNDSMRSLSTITMKGILGSYDGFGDVGLLVDVGGGVGTTLGAILKKHPRVRGINFDLPHVISNAPAISGVEHIAGDMFESVPAGDAIFIKFVLLNWSDEHCVKLLRNCREAIAPDGKVIVMDCCRPEYPEHTKAALNAFHLDLTMMTTHSGKVRSKKDLESLAKEAGFSKMEAVCSYSSYWLLEFYK